MSSSSSRSTHGSGMDGSDSSYLAVARLPDDALVEILSRLGAKSLCRCKCVSKPWRDLISDRLCCKDLPKILQGFLYFDVVICDGDEDEDDVNGSSNGDADADGGGGGDGVNSSDDGDAVANGRGGDGGDDDNGSNHSDADADGRDLASGRAEMLLRYGHGHFINLLGKPVSLLDSSFAFMKEPPGIEAVAFFDSCNGLLLFVHGRVSGTYNSLGYIVCNPVTEQWVAVPSSGWTPTPQEEAVEGPRKQEHTFLIFDPSVSSHFDLVQFWHDGLHEVEGVHTYSSVTGLWSDRSSEWRGQGGGWEKWGYAAEIESPFREIESPFRGRALVNGMLHILIHQLQTYVYEIVAVDSQGRTCRVIQWPEKRSSASVGLIGQSQGRLHCCSTFSDFRSCVLSIWVLEDYDTEEWVLKHSVSLSHLFEGVDPVNLVDYSSLFGVDPCPIDRLDYHYEFVGLHTDRNMMFIVLCGDRTMISYDMDSREVRVLCTLTPGRGSPYVTPYVPSLRLL